MGVIHKIGRRKPLLHVFMFRKEQKITVNKAFETYFNATLQYNQCLWQVSNFDVKVNVYGGGSTGQAEAVRMALARVMWGKCRKQSYLETRRFVNKRSKNGWT
jgi:small subunit ribosomal protein S9